MRKVYNRLRWLLLLSGWLDDFVDKAWSKISEMERLRSEDLKAFELRLQALDAKIQWNATNFDKQLADLRNIMITRPAAPPIYRARSASEFRHMTTDENGEARLAAQDA